MADVQGHIGPSQLLWFLAPNWPGPAAEAVFAALATSARRCVRASCRAGREAIDACVQEIDVSERGKDEWAGLAPALAAGRFPRLRRLVFGSFQRERALGALLGVLEAAGPRAQLASLEARLSEYYYEECEIEQLAAAAAAACGRLRSLKVEADQPTADACCALLGLLGRLPELTRLSLDATSVADVGDTFAESAAEIPWAGAAELERLGWDFDDLLCCIAAQPMPYLGALAAGFEDSAAAAAVWGAPWLSQLSRLELRHLNCAEGLLAGLPCAGLKLPGLLELGLTVCDVTDMEDREVMAPARAASLAACDLPALRRLSAESLGERALAPLLGAPWVSRLRRLEMACCPDFFTPAGVAALRAAPFARLTFLALMPGWVRGMEDDRHVSFLAPVLSAPWAASLRHLEVRAGAVSRALAAAPLPGLRSLRVEAYFEPRDAAHLSSAPWLSGLTELALDDTNVAGEIGTNLSLGSWHLPRLESLDLCIDMPMFAGIEAMRALAAAPWLQQLERLKITARHFRDAHHVALSPESAAAFEALRRRGARVDVRFQLLNRDAPPRSCEADT